MKKANLSPNAFRYWSRCKAAKYEDGRAVFLHKESIIKKYQYLINDCTKLDGFVQSQAFCNFTGIAPSHLIKSNGADIYKILDIMIVENIKFINLRALLNSLDIPHDSTIYIERCSYFAPLEKKIQLTKNLCVGYY